jgi:hypothetical protein
VILVVCICYRNKEKIVIEDSFVYQNHYVGMVLTTSRNIYTIEYKYSRNNTSTSNLEEQSSYLLKQVIRKDKTMTKEDWKKLNQFLLQLKQYDNNCTSGSSNNTSTVLSYYDYQNDNIITLNNGDNCNKSNEAVQNIIDIIQKYSMWTSDI